MTADEKIAIFKRELSLIKNNTIRAIAEYLLSDVPNYFFKIPASSTNKYHPAYSLGEGGLVRHTKSACLFASMLQECWTFENSIDFDYAICALIIHDTRKLGMTDKIQEKYTVFEHPLLAKNAVLKAYHESELSSVPELETHFVNISNAIASHMGKWNTSKYSPNVILPIPQTNLEKFVHMCDYLASRKELDVINLF